jgi:5-methylcytosine-specific restriction protein B
MALVKVAAIMWRKLNKANVDTLAGRSNGQYHLTLGTPTWLDSFFSSLPQTPEGSNGGYVYQVPLEPFDGENPVAAEQLTVKFMGDGSARKDWNVPAQRPTTAYPLWRMGRGLPVDHVYAATDQHWVVIVKDDQNRYHARWINPAIFATLPPDLQQRLAGSDIGQWVDQAPAQSGGVLEQSDLVSRILSRLYRNYNVLLYGPPGTGKTHLIQEVMKAMTANGLLLDTLSEQVPFQIENMGMQTRSAWATFHQSYSYEDFIVSLRPEPAAGTMLNLVPSPGLLIELAEFARQPNCSALLVIDEVNRGNVSRIFGEFITLLEADKRLTAEGEESLSTIKIRFPYVKEKSPLTVTIDGEARNVPSPFTMPRRVYTLATMNSVDKSVAPLDTALRRRFEVVDLPVDFTLVAQVMGLPADFTGAQVGLPPELTEISHIQKLSIGVLNKINNHLAFFLGQEFCLGHWYLAAMANAKTFGEAQTAMNEVWDAKILPQLEELFRGRTDQLENVLGLGDYESVETAPVYVDRPADALTELGATPILRRRDVPFSDFVRYLRHVGQISVLQEAVVPVESTQPGAPELPTEQVAGVPEQQADAQG